MHNWTRTIAVAHLAAALLTGCGPASHADPVSTNATVLRAVDGDTLDVSSDSRGRLRIRVVGLDTPETTAEVGPWDVMGRRRVHTPRQP